MNFKTIMNCLMITVFAFNLGTTYVIKEGGKEVGRYDENDGSSETKILGNEVSIPAVEKKAKPVQGGSKIQDIWGARRGPNAPGSPERLAKEARGMTPEEALKQAAELKKKSEDKNLESQTAVEELEKG